MLAQLLNQFHAQPIVETKREIQSDNRNVISNDVLNKTIISNRSMFVSGREDDLNSEIHIFLLHAWSDKHCLSTLIVLMTLFGSFLFQHADLRLRMVGARIRIACCSLIYRKV